VKLLASSGLGITDAKARETYLEAFTCPLGDGYDYLDCALSPSQAKARQETFKKIESAA
jgi:hypothetical protein